jgi:hypothetical protein
MAAGTEGKPARCLPGKVTPRKINNDFPKKYEDTKKLGTPAENFKKSCTEELCACWILLFQYMSLNHLMNLATDYHLHLISQILNQVQKHFRAKWKLL